MEGREDAYNALHGQGHHPASRRRTAPSWLMGASCSSLPLLCLPAPSAHHTISTRPRQAAVSQQSSSSLQL